MKKGLSGDVAQSLLYKVALVVCNKLLLTFTWEFRNVTKLG